MLDLDPEYPFVRRSMASAKEQMKEDRPVARAIRDAIAEVVAEAKRLPRPTLAMCMIAKDEEEFIEDAIRSVEGLADEVVVVDTGSSDDTVDIAKRAGARVEFFPWNGSFADARNVSLDYATSDWILVLDADERVHPSSRSAIRSILESEDDLRVVCPKIKNYTRDKRFLNDGFSGRIFRPCLNVRASNRMGTSPIRQPFLANFAHNSKSRLNPLLFSSSFFSFSVRINL